MIIAFTICSANYLAQAKALGNSLILHNPEYHFVIGLVDRIEHRIKYSYWEPYELIEVESLEIDGFNDMSKRYDIVELNTAVKPFYIEYLFKRNPNVEAVIYIDPDILVYDNFKQLEEKINLYNIILTPHFFTANDDDIHILYEKVMIKSGIYNLGFIATSRSQETFAFLSWWQKRLKQYCLRHKEGLFVDQKWLNLVPLYYQKVHIEKHPGYNVAHWNLLERKISCLDGKYIVNNKHNLVFFHFSSYNPLKPEQMSKADFIPLSEREDLHSLFENYRKSLLNNNYELIKDLKCYFIKNNEKQQNQMNQKGYKPKVKKMIKKSLSLLPKKLKQTIKKINMLILDSI